MNKTMVLSWVERYQVKRCSLPASLARGHEPSDINRRHQEGLGGKCSMGCLDWEASPWHFLLLFAYSVSICLDLEANSLIKSHTRSWII
jgi:hypothetical protein